MSEGGGSRYGDVMKTRFFKTSLPPGETEKSDLESYAHTVAHQLRLPLAGISLTAQLLEEDCDMMSSEELRRDLRAIRMSAHKMSDIIEELLLFAGTEVTEAHLEPIDMSTVIASVMVRLQPLFTEYGADIAFPDTWPEVIGYAPWVEEVWVNYISNAVKYGGRPPRVELGAFREPDGRICFTVRDNGAGLRADEVRELFRPFRRLGKTSPGGSSPGGSGLGLSIARRMTERLRGKVMVESDVGKGSVFGFSLPTTSSRMRLQ